MCTETFLRLPEEKRSRFLDAAWEEFTTVPFIRASINQIVRRARIPRGSFYQYFADKGDLFQYLMESIRQEMQSSYRKLLMDAGGDLFQAAETAHAMFLAERRRGEVPVLDRCVRIVRINPGMDLESLITRNADEFIVDGILTEIDVSRFRCRDREFLRQVCLLVGMSLIGAIMDTLCNPDGEERYQRELRVRLEILRTGSLCPENAGAGMGRNEDTGRL